MKPKLNHHHISVTTAINGCSTQTCTSTSSPPPPSSPRNHRLDRRRRPSRSRSFIRRRSSLSFLVLPLLYTCGFLMCMGPFYSVMHPNPLPGSVYRTHELFQRLWNDIQSENSSSIQLDSVWRYQRRKLNEEKLCPNMNIGKTFGTAANERYLVVEANGGLNQQRSAICNAVAVAALLDAILVIPRLEFHNVWRDPSVFGDVYDESHFIELLDGLVKVVHDLPEELMEVYDSNISNIPATRVHAWATAKYYLEEIKPILNKQQVIRIAPFANRLAMKVPPHIQLLRCHANYKALRFSPKISTLAKRLVSKMMEKSSSMGGNYISIHLRFEEDMVAFSCCVYNGGEAEKSVMDSIREKGWGNKFKRKDRFFSPGLNRVDGKCPMTPLEVGMMLRGMGFGNDAPVYLASGKIYQEELYLAPLKKMFPLLQSKESLTSTDELASFEGYSTRLAALDYMVCLSSEVFVTTQGGNFPHFLMGHRRFLFNGHAKTIKPDKSKLVLLFQDMNISWNGFKDELGKMLDESDRKGIMMSRVGKSNRKSSIFLNPLPECKCLWESRNSSSQLDDIY